MPSKFTYMLGVAASCVLLASCGGDGGGTPTPSPTPTGTGTPSPSPTPTATATPTLDNFDFSEDIEVLSGRSFVFAYFTPNSGGAEVWSDGRLINLPSALAYEVNPERVRFRFTTEEATVEFAGSDRTATTPTQRTYANSAGTLFLQTPFDHVLRAIFQRTDPFTRDTVPGTLRSRRVVIYNNTPTAASPITNPITYTGDPLVAGGRPGITPPGAVTSSERTFTLNPSTSTSTGGTLTGTIPIFETINGVPTLQTTITINVATSLTGTFFAEIANAGDGFTGQIVGTLAGPGLDEISLTFLVAHADGRKYLGNIIGD